MASAIILLTVAILPTRVNAIEKRVPMLYKASLFRRIVLKGNIEVTLVQRPSVGISYADDNAGSVKVTQQGEVLRITGNSTTLCKIVVYVGDIYRIEANENAIVKTEARLSTKFLQIILNGNAFADIDTSTEGLYTEIHDTATLKLKGNTNHHTLIMGKTPNLTIDKFAANQTSVSYLETKESKIAAIAPIEK